ncbi:MAG: alpha/beta hydrolase [Halieaceae bacterium]
MNHHLEAKMQLAATLLILLTALTCPVAAGANPLTEDPVPDKMFPPMIEEITISSSGSRMSGLLYLANGLGPHPTVVLLHGFPGNEKNLDIAQVLRRAGFNIMFFHYRGAWGSEGDYRLGQLVVDVKAALDFLRDNATRYRVNTRQLTLLGHSMGGFAALAAASKDASLACVGAMAPANLGLIAEGLRSGEPSALQFLDYADGLFMLHNFDGKQMREDLLSEPVWKLDTRLFGPGLRGKSVFMITGQADVVTPPASMFEPTVAAYLRDPGIKLQHFAIPGDHSFSYSRLQLTELVLAWLQANCR